MDLAGLDGAVCHATNTIVVAEGLSPDRERETLLHELMHVVWTQMGLSRGDVDEERIVDALAKGLTAVLKDNSRKRLRRVFE